MSAFHDGTRHYNGLRYFIISSDESASGRRRDHADPCRSNLLLLCVIKHSHHVFNKRRIRHITAIQIRNLTPFPVRDAFASALTQPAEQSQFSSHGHLSDDLDVTVSRKRSRKISSTSAATHGSLWSDEGLVEDRLARGVGEKGKNSSASRVSFSPGTGSRGRPHSASGSTPAGRPQRHRTNSSVSHLSGTSLPPSTPSAGLISPLTTVLPDNSQTGLEKVINARLVETFLAITAPQPPHVGSPSAGPMSLSPSSGASSPRDKSFKKSTDSNLMWKNNRAPPSSPSLAKHVRHETVSSTSSKIPNNHAKSASMSVLRSNGKNTGTIHPNIPPPHPSPSPSQELQVPNYISPIRRPSTNPLFPIDAKSNSSFSQGTDLSGDKVKIQVWGKVGERWKKDVGFQSKGKEKEVEQPEEPDNAWKILDEWFVDLMDLEPLSDEVRNLLFFFFRTKRKHQFYPYSLLLILLNCPPTHS